MLHHCFRKAMLLVALASGIFFVSDPASAVTINVTYPSSAPDWTHWHYSGGSMSQAQINSAANAVITQAKTWWAGMFSENRTLNWTVQWGGNSAGSNASTTISWSGGRPSSATIKLDANRTWFLDRTPWSALDDWTEVHQTTSVQQPGFNMPTGFYYSGGSGIAATSNTIDLLTTVMHEMGHAMGLSATNPRVTGDFIASNTGTQYNGAYIDLFSDSSGLHTDANNKGLMYHGSLVNIRKLPSAHDILAVQRAGGWTGTVNSYWLNPLNQNPIRTVPEPGTYLMLACGLVALPLVCRARKS